MLKIVYNDVKEGLFLWRFWTALAVDELSHRYKRTAIGLVWVPLSFCAFIAAQAAVFSFLNTADFDYFLTFLTLGFLIWQLISAMIIDGCVSFISAYGYIHTKRLPYSVFVFQMVFRNIIIFVMTLPAVAIVLIPYGKLTYWQAWSLLPALIVTAINGVIIGVIFGTLCARFRDLQHIAATAMRVLFFVTPIVWLPSSLGEVGKLSIYNPFVHYIDIFRAPLLDGVIPISSWIIVGLLTLTFGFMAAVTFYHCRRRIPFWL
jgi:ABC-type polysaccharide/polyol phosphate export permease